jgi:hypothetical protein
MKAMWTKIKHAGKKQKPIHNIVASKQTQKQRKPTNNPHSEDGLFIYLISFNVRQP